MIQVSGLKKYFLIKHNPLSRLGHPDHVIKAVDGVSFDIKAGEIFGLVGESGCGKTTLAKTMLRLYQPTAGSVMYKDKNIFLMDKVELKKLRRRTQIIFQDSNSTLDPRMNAAQLLVEPLLLHKMGDRKTRKKRIIEMMQRVKLPTAFLERYPSELWGGQRQRLSIARALLLEPNFIVADEPLAGLDPVVSTQLLDLILSLKNDQLLTYLFISHDLSTVAYAADRIAVMYRGRIVELIDAKNFQSEAKHPYTRFLLALDSSNVKIDIDEGVHIHSQHSEDGCVYSERCPYSIDICIYSSPNINEISPGHHIACHLKNNG